MPPEDTSAPLQRGDVGEGSICDREMGAGDTDQLSRPFQLLTPEGCGDNESRREGSPPAGSSSSDTCIHAIPCGAGLMPVAFGCVFVAGAASPTSGCESLRGLPTAAQSLDKLLL